MGEKALEEAIPRATKDELLNPRQVQADYGFSPQTLANWRWTGSGPEFIKLSPGRGGRIRYKRSRVEAWLDSCTVAGGQAA